MINKNNVNYIYVSSICKNHVIIYKFINTNKSLLPLLLHIDVNVIWNKKVQFSVSKHFINYFFSLINVIPIAIDYSIKSLTHHTLEIKY